MQVFTSLATLFGHDYVCLWSVLFHSLSHCVCVSARRYMKRRCAFLDNLPSFNYNTGAGEYVKNEHGSMVTTDTKHLGSTLMTTMLNEVSDFCDPAIKENWSLKPHQQVSTRLCTAVSSSHKLIVISLNTYCILK